MTDAPPIQIDVADLMTTPEGMVRRGDEFHRPEDLRTCRRCGAEGRARAEQCFNCGLDADAEPCWRCPDCGNEWWGETFADSEPIGHYCEATGEYTSGAAGLVRGGESG